MPKAGHGNLICHLEAGSHYEARAGLELTILLLAKSWDDAMNAVTRTRTASRHSRRWMISFRG